MFVANQPCEAAFKLFRAGAGSAKEGAAFGHSDEGGLEFLQYASEVIDYLFDVRGEPGYDFSHGVVEFLDDSSVGFAFVLGDFLVFCQFFLYSFQEFLGGLVLEGGGQPVRVLAHFIHLNSYNSNQTSFLNSKTNIT